MGLFDTILGNSKGKDLSPAESFMGVLLGACLSDEVVADEEFAGMVTMLRRMRLFEDWTAEKFQSTHNKLFAVYKKRGIEEMLDRCIDGLPQKLHLTSFACACDIVLADGVVEAEEKEFMEMLQKKLSLSGDDALEIVDVLVIKNKG